MYATCIHLIFRTVCEVIFEICYLKATIMDSYKSGKSAQISNECLKILKEMLNVFAYDSGMICPAELSR